MKTLEKTKVFIIGAGISGVSCAHRLMELNKDYEVTIFEASNEYGGRIKSLKNFASFDIELGGEEIHGNNNHYYKLAEKCGGKIFEYWEKNEIYANFKGELCSFDKSDIPEIKRIREMFDDISYEFNHTYEDITLREYLNKYNYSTEVHHIANAMLGVEAGTDLDSASAYGFNDICRRWKSGEDNYLISNLSHIDVMEKSFPEAIKKIKFNCAINSIDYSQENKVIITDSKNNIYEGHKCILTIPITQYQNKSISFTPAFSKEKTNAFNSIKIDSCAKLVLKFNKIFWPENTSWILIKGDANIYWPTSQGKNSNDILLSSLISGRSCDNLRQLYKIDKQKFIDKIITDLEDGLLVKNLKDNLVNYFWQDWTSIPFIEGGYTYPSVGEQNVRDIAKQPISNLIFFGGEAFALHGHIATIHGAVERGIEAAEEVNQSFNLDL